MVLDDPTFTVFYGHDKIVKQNRSAQCGSTSCLTICLGPWTALAAHEAQQPTQTNKRADTP